LCGRVEQYVNQDYVPRREMLLTPAEIEAKPEEIDEPEHSSVKRFSRTLRLSHREFQVLTLLIITKDEEFYDRCCEVLDLSYNNAKQVMAQLRKRLINDYR
jgi:hypothetical protein